MAWGLFKSLVPGLVPPRDFTDTAAVYSWSVSVSVTVVIMGGLTVANTVLMWGFAPVLFAGFASAADIQSVQNSQNRVEKLVEDSSRDLKVTFLRDRLFTYRANQCRAIRAGDLQLAASIGIQIQNARDEHYRITSMVYELRPCEEFN